MICDAHFVAGLRIFADKVTVPRDRAFIVLHAFPLRLTMTRFAVSRATINKSAAPLRLEIRASDAQTWPGLAICVHALVHGARVPLDQLQTDGGRFRHQDSTLAADPLD